MVVTLLDMCLGVTRLWAVMSPMHCSAASQMVLTNFCARCPGVVLGLSFTTVQFWSGVANCSVSAHVVGIMVTVCFLLSLSFGFPCQHFQLPPCPTNHDAVIVIESWW